MGRASAFSSDDLRRDATGRRAIQGVNRGIRAARVGVLLLAAAAFQGALAEPPGSPDFDPKWMPPRAARESPSARTADEGSRVPGDVRPGVAVPQLSIPFKGSEGGKAQNQMRARPSAGGIDDAAAQCRAKKSKEDREKCERALYEAGDAYGK